MDKDTGGSAFPLKHVSYGMTLRDYQAAHAPITFEMAGVLAYDQYGAGYTTGQLFASMAELRYSYADAMLTERAFVK